MELLLSFCFQQFFCHSCRIKIISDMLCVHDVRGICRLPRAPTFFSILCEAHIFSRLFVGWWHATGYFERLWVMLCMPRVAIFFGFIVTSRAHSKRDVVMKIHWDCCEHSYPIKCTMSHGVLSKLNFAFSSRKRWREFGFGSNNLTF